MNFRALLKQYVSFLVRRAFLLTGFFVLSVVASVYFASHLELRSDFKELLPDNYASVRDLNRILERIGGIGNLIVAVESDDIKASERFTEDFVAALKLYPPHLIRDIDYNINPLKKFLNDNKYLYIDKTDLETIYTRLSRGIQREKLTRAGLLLNFETESEQKNERFDFSDIEEKYVKKAGGYDKYTDGYFFGEEGRLLAILVKPYGSVTGVEASKKLIAQVEETIHQLNPTSYHPSLKVGLTGKFKATLQEYRSMIDDVLATAFLAIGLVSLSIFIYFRRFRMLFLTSAALITGVAWTFAVTYFHIGYLTAQTAFLGSIIVGNGINYGLIFMARYLEERRKKQPVLEALTITVQTTFLSTLASSLTTSIGFATLGITEVKGFSQFGFIGGCGMFLCWVATYTSLPVFLVLSEKVLPIVHEKKVYQPRRLLMAPLAHFIERYPGWIVRFGTFFTIASFGLILFFVPNSLEYDFSKLRFEHPRQKANWENNLAKRVENIFDNLSLSPAIILVDQAEQAPPLCQEIEKKKKQEQPPWQTISSCKSLFSYLPEDQEIKLSLLPKIRKLLDDPDLRFLNAQQLKTVREFKEKLNLKGLTVEDLPHEITRNFVEKDGHLGRIVYVYPRDDVNMWNGQILIRFADAIRENKLPTGEIITSSGEAVIFADLLKGLVRDGPKAVVASLLGVTLVVLIFFWNSAAYTFILMALGIGVLWMGGLVSLFHLKLNFFNFIAIPTTFGIGVDYAVNLFQRYRLEGKGSIRTVIQETGGAIGLCSVTTIIGYWTLVIARNKALSSFGWIAILGEFACVAAALIFLPAFLLLLEKRKKD
ncbi:MAG: MMPL family transporter [Deltaproteobacteria bacterium]|nr:MMPL family transporter [Deltaproteobacteria bacterium]